MTEQYAPLLEIRIIEQTERLTVELRQCEMTEIFRVIQTLYRCVIQLQTACPYLLIAAAIEIHGNLLAVLLVQHIACHSVDSRRYA